MKASEIFSGNFREAMLILRHYPMLSNFRSIGSVETLTDNEDSDIDLYVDAKESTTLFDIGNAIEELEDLFGVPVDIITSGAIMNRKRIKNYLGGKEDFYHG